MKGNLTHLPALYESCFDAILRRPAAIPTTRVSGSTKRDQFNDEAIQVRRDIDDVLRSWAGLIAEKLGLPVPGGEVTELVEFLLAHLDWLMASTAAQEFAEEVAELRRRAEQVVGGTPPQRHDLGSCIKPSCDGWLTARPAPGRSAASQVVCNRGHSWQPQEWLLLSARIAEREAS